MDPRLQRRVQRYGWDKAADVYEGFWANALRPAQERLLALARIQPGEHVLDVACGTGLVALPAAESVGAGGRVLATDISDAMVLNLRATAAANGLAHLSVERMDAESLDVADATFDVVLCALGLMYVPDPARALAEMHRSLRPGGRTAVAVWGARSRCRWAEIFPIVEKRVASEVCPLFFQLGSGDALSYTLEQAGFRDIVTERIDAPIHYDTAEEACGAAFAGGPVALAYSHFDPPTRESAHAEYLESIEAYRSGSMYDVPGEFVVAIGAKL